MRTKIQGKANIIKYYQDKEVVSTYFNQRFSSLFGKLKNELQIRVINSFLKTIKPSKILDLALGTGRITRKLKYYTQGYGIDTSQEMLSSANKFLEGWKLKKGDAFNIPFKEKFDVIISTRFIWHFNKKKRKELFKEIHKKLNPKSYLIFDFPNKNIKRIVPKKSKIGKKIIYTHSWTRREIIKELKENNFKVVSIKPILKNPQKLYDLSSKSNHFLTYIRMKLIDKFSNKEAYTYIVLAKKLD